MKNIFLTRLLASLLIFSIISSAFPVAVVEAVQPVTQTLTLPKILATLPSMTSQSNHPPLDVSGHDSSSAFIKKPPVIKTLTKKSYRSDEDVTASILNTDNNTVNISVVDIEGKEADVDIVKHKTMTETVVDITPKTQFRPGKYMLVVTDTDGNRVEQDFRWGVLAINTNRSIYTPGQTANLSLAVLDDKGNMVCDAKVELGIKNPSLGIDEKLSTDNGKIVTNDQCTSHAFSLEPDYEASYEIGGKGIYEMKLTAQTSNGTFTITDKFIVQENTPFDIERVSATRIYPPNNYPMNLTITANQDFEGTITETVPESFEITPSEVGTTYNGSTMLYLEKKQDPTANLAVDVLGASTSGLLLPFAGSYSITQGFGQINTAELLSKFYQNFSLSGHDGVDFGIPENTPIFAVDDGNVILADNGDYGITVVIQHIWGKSYYGHLNKVTVDKNMTIKKGTQIGLSGNTGESTGPHLHFGMKPNNPDLMNGYYGKIDSLPYFNLPSTSTFASNTGAAIAKTGVLSASTSATTSFIVLEDQLRKNILMQDTPAKNEKVKLLQWHVSLKKGEEATLSYQFKTPQISPQFYLLGPLHFYAKDKPNDAPIFQETRPWQIAADAVGIGWYNDSTEYGGYSWQYRKQITTTSSSSLIPSTQTNFPMLVSLTADADLIANAQNDGDDILFAGANGTKLDHEIEAYSNGTLWAWVEVPSLSTSTSIYMYYGNPSASNQQNVNGTWSNGFVAVQHLEETATCPITFTDSTSNANNGSCNGSVSGPIAFTTGKIDGARDFERSQTQYISIADQASQDVTNGTFETWARLESIGIFQFLIEKGIDDHDNYSLYITNGNRIELFFEDSSGGFHSSTGATSLTTATWYHIVGVIDDTNNVFRIYLNGVQNDSVSEVFTMAAKAGTLHMGREDFGGGSSYFDGVMDEARVSNVARTANWITAEYNNQNSPSTFYSLGEEETKNYAPTPEQMMRHGSFFNQSGDIQPFTF